jgi:hypothetical protein
MGSMSNSEVGHSIEQLRPTSSVAKELTHHCETTVIVEASRDERSHCWTITRDSPPT